MTECFETNTNTEKDEIIENIKGELNALSLGIKKESFNARQELKAEIKRLGFYDGDENGENVRFNISKIKKYLNGIKNKNWTDLDVRSSELEKGVWTIAVQIAINYISKNGKSTTEIDLIDGVRGRQTWKCVKEFQTTYNLKNKDGLPGHETITKILELLGNNHSDNLEDNSGKSNEGNDDKSKNDLWNDNRGNNGNLLGNSGKNKEGGGDNIENSNIIEDNKCGNLLKNLEIQNDDNLENNKEGNSFKSRLNAKIKDKGGIEGIVFKNPQIQDLLSNIVNHQGQVIQHMKNKHEKNKSEIDKTKKQDKKNEEVNETDKEAVKSWEEYKYEKNSQEGFEEFILSDEGIAIVMDEIKSHIDTNHKNERGEYDKFYEEYPVSEKNLEIKLKTAWESKLKSKYFEENYDEEKREEMEKKDVLSNKIIGYVDKIIGDDMKSGCVDFNQKIIGELNGLLSEGIDGLPMNEFLSNQDQKDSFKEILANKIKIYWNTLGDKKDVNLNTGDKQIDLQLKSYLYVYGKIFYSDYIKSNKDITYYEGIIPDVMRCIISKDDESLINKIKHIEFLVHERKLEEERKKRDLQRRQNVAKRNRELNNKILSSTRKGLENRHTNTDSNSNDVNHQTGEQLARNVDLGDYDTQTDLSEVADSSNAKQYAFLLSWENFIKSNSTIKDLSLGDIQLIFDMEKNRIDESARKNFLDKDIMKGRSNEEINEIYRILSSFPAEYDKTLKYMASGINKQAGVIDNKIKNSALGSVIDNVKSIFADIVKKGDSKFEGFKFNEDEPVKREGNDIIISGTFNGTDTRVRYDLNSGELFMNSFFQHPSNSEIIFGKNSKANLKIGQLDSFDNILHNHYRTPDISLTTNTYIQNIGALNKNNITANQPKNQYASIMQMQNQGMSNLADVRKKYSEIFKTNFDMIGSAIVDNSKKQNAINSIVTKFMKTFNIIPSSGEFGSLQFHAGSNLFDIIQIIEETGSPKKGDIQSLEYFSNEFMPTIMNYSCLKWGNNNLNGPQKNEENKEYYDITFDDQHKNNHISLIREGVKDFSQNLQKFKPGGIKNYDSDYQLGFADFIKNNFVKGSQPDWTLDITKMKEFIYNLKTKDKEIKDNDVDQDEKLNKDLYNLI